MKTKNLEENTLTELKALVYDLMVKSQEINRELQIANNVIAKKELELKAELKESK